jgi:HAD superfamily hydrolase (TIGR01549 family)
MKHHPGNLGLKYYRLIVEPKLSNKIKAVTFDLWDTVISDESDEPKRLAAGMRSKPDERFHTVFEALNAHQPISTDELKAGYGVVNSAFVKCWKGHFITWTARERLEVLFTGLGRTLPEAEMDALVLSHERMEVETPPDPIEGAKDAIAELASRYKLCVISDTIVTPANGLRDWLEIHDLKQYFSGFAFSDEVGRSKPHRSMFDSAAQQLGSDFSEMVHIGDRDHNDVKGPQALGMKAVLFTAKRDNDKDTTSADAICERHADLPGVIDALSD